MKKSLARSIKKPFKKLFCPHWYWRHLSSFEAGSFRSVIIECRECGKRKLDWGLRPWETYDEDTISELFDRLLK